MSMNRQVMRAVVALPMIFAAGCFPKGATDPLANAANMSAQSVPTASSIIGESAAPRPSVIVTNNGGKGVPGAPVTFTVSAGNGSVTTTLVSTDKQGIAAVGWTYGLRAGENRLTATLATLPPVTFVVMTTGGGPSDMVKANDGQSGAVGDALAQPVAVVVHDRGGSPVVGASVAFTALGGSTLTGPGVTTAVVATDAAGRAQTAWTMGTVPGSYGLTAAVSGVPTATFSATAVVGPPAQIVKTGDAQTGTVNTALPNPIGVTVRDRFQNPIPGVAINYAPQGGGTVSPATDATVASGQSTTQWTLPTVAGNASLLATAGNLSATFSATANPGAPARLEKMVSSDGQTGDPGQPLPQLMAVTVRDAFGNALRGVSVGFAPAAGSVNPATVATDATGQANTTWTLGMTPGPTTLDASAVGIASPVSFTATVRSADPCASHGTLVVSVAVTGNLANSTCDFPLRRTHVDLWTLDLNASTPLEVVETIDNPVSPDAYMAMYRDQYAPASLIAGNDDIDANRGNYNSHVLFLGGAGHFLVGASYAQWFAGDPGTTYHLVANRWSGAVTSCQEVFAVSGTNTNQILDSDDCPATSTRQRSDRILLILRPGETVVVTMNSTIFDTKLDFANSGGVTVASDDNGGGGTNSRLVYTVPATAPAYDTYAIYATSTVAGAGGGYSLAVNVTSPPPAAPMLSTRALSTVPQYGPGIARLAAPRKARSARRE